MPCRPWLPGRGRRDSFAQRRRRPFAWSHCGPPRYREAVPLNDYDEFGLFHENAEEFGLPFNGPPTVRRDEVEVAPGQRISALVWGTEEPEIVSLHGGAQNAHTWDRVALALDRPLVAVDLPGHGHSSWRDDLDYRPSTMADDVAKALRQLAPRPRLLVGMSLGGMTAMSLAARYPDLAPKLAIVDVTPGATREKASQIIGFVDGPQRFEGFDAILERTVQFNPTRSVSSLRRGILHNAVMDEDAGWSWRYDRRRREGGQGMPDNAALWDDVSAIRGPILLLRGSLSPVVDDDDVAEFRGRQPTAQVVVVDGAGHSIQGD